MSLALHLCTQPTTRWDAKPVRSTRALPVQQATQHQKLPSRCCLLAVVDCCAVSADGFAEYHPSLHYWPEEGVDSQLQHQGLDEGLLEEVVGLRDWLGLCRCRPCPKRQLQTC